MTDAEQSLIEDSKTILRRAAEILDSASEITAVWPIIERATELMATCNAVEQSRLERGSNPQAIRR